MFKNMIPLRGKVLILNLGGYMGVYYVNRYSVCNTSMRIVIIVINLGHENKWPNIHKPRVMFMSLLINEAQHYHDYCYP